MDVLEYVKYGTFAELCKNFINDPNDLGKMSQNLITSNLGNLKDRNSDKKRILLIDEVDVFFGADF